MPSLADAVARPLDVGTEAAPTETRVASPKDGLLRLSVVALGVMYGDLGSGPRFVFRECFRLGALPVEPSTVLGVLSCIVWSLTLVVSIKYLLYLMRARHEGEGGVLVLTNLLARREQRPQVRSIVCGFGIVGVALLLGQSAITPALSVLSAVEGLAVVVPRAESAATPIGILLVVALFAFQRRGTAVVGFAFAPVLLLWFGALALVGSHSIVGAPAVLSALSPTHAFALFARLGSGALPILGGVFLSVSGSEVLYDAIGHVGPRPVRWVWTVVVFPGLVLSYLGQGAELLMRPASIGDPLFAMVPAWGQIPFAALSATVAVTAAQGVISSVFSLVRQASALGLIPKVKIEHSGSIRRGQVYVPALNRALMLVAAALVFTFRSSRRLAPAYMLDASAAMLVTTLLAARSARVLPWRSWHAVAAMSLLAVLELGFFVVIARETDTSAFLLLLLTGVLLTFLVRRWQTAFAEPTVSSPRERLVPVKAPKETQSACLDDELVAAFVEGTLRGEALTRVDVHLAGCEDCATVVAHAAYATVNVSASRPSSNEGATIANARGAFPLASPHRFVRGALIGQGGMGEVYVARDLLTGRSVAVKRLKTEAAIDDPDLMARFAREAEILRRLDHPNIVRMLAIERRGEQDELIMEYVDGGSLRDLLRTTPRLPVRRALGIVLELTDALSRAHHLGVIHRDIKPENVLLTSDGTPRLADFGLARMADGFLTSPRMVIGTVAYLSPEALWNRSPDARTDVWSLGVMLFEMLSGRRPFEGENYGALVTAILHQPTPDLSIFCEEATTEVVDLVHRMLAKNSAERTPSARQVGAEIEAALRSTADAGVLLK